MGLFGHAVVAAADVEGVPQNAANCDLGHTGIRHYRTGRRTKVTDLHSGQLGMGLASRA